jgi:urea transporter
MSNFGIVQSFLRQYSQIWLQSNALSGLLILLAIALYSIPAMLNTLLCSAACLIIANHLQLDRATIKAGIYGYNAILVSMAVDILFEPSPFKILITLGVATTCTLGIQLFLERHTPLAPFTAPFVLTTWAIYLCKAPLGLQLALPLPVEQSYMAIGYTVSVLNGISQVAFITGLLPGLCILSALSIAQHKLMPGVLLCSIIGVVYTLMIGDPLEGMAGLNSYSLVLSALALAKLPLRYQVSGLTLTLAIQQGFAGLPIPVLTAPFILACWITQLIRQRHCIPYVR